MIPYKLTLSGFLSYRQPVELEPGQEVSASTTWDTSRITVAPSAPVIVFVPGGTGSSGGCPAPFAVLVYCPERSWQARQSTAVDCAGGGDDMSSQP